MFKFILSVTLLLQLLLQTECCKSNYDQHYFRTGAYGTKVFAGESCIADEEYGSCIPLLECAPLLQEIRRQGNPMPTFLRIKLQRLTCGFEYAAPMVCCVQTPVVPQEQNWGTFHVATQPTPQPTNSDSLNFVNSGENYNNNNNNNNNNDNTEPITRKPIENRRGGPPDIEGNPKLSLLPQKCGSIESDRIWGGNRTRLFEMPWMALLSYDSGRGLKLACGGTIINEWYVLTAAHCVSFLGNNMRLDGVILGEHDVRTDPDCEMSDGVEYCAPRVTNSSIASVIAHPGYSPQTLKDDIALIRLAEPANFKLESVKPICLPIDRTLQTENLAGKIGVVAGWGVTEEGLQSPVLLSVDLPIVSYKDCYAAYNGTLQITKKQVCAGGVKDKDSCGGDSGGPLLYPGKYGTHGLRYIQRGLVSFGSKRCGLAGYPGVYTNIAYYMDWILDNMHA